MVKSSAKFKDVVSEGRSESKNHNFNESMAVMAVANHIYYREAST